MGVVGYDKVATKVIEGKSKCIYKKPKGTKEYVMGFGKIRTVESYVKLCRKKAAKKAAKSKMAKPKMTKPKMAKRMRSKSAKRYGGFLEQFLAEHTEGLSAQGAAPSKDKKEMYASPPMSEKYMTKENMVDPMRILSGVANDAKGAFNGGSSCNKGGQQQQQQQQQQHNNNNNNNNKNMADKNKRVENVEKNIHQINQY